MSKKINVNPNYYKVGGREPAEGADQGDSGTPNNVHLGTQKKRGQPELPGHKKDKHSRQ